MGVVEFLLDNSSFQIDRFQCEIRDLFQILLRLELIQSLMEVPSWDFGLDHMVLEGMFRHRLALAYSQVRLVLQVH